MFATSNGGLVEHTDIADVLSQADGRTMAGNNQLVQQLGPGTCRQHQSSPAGNFL
jgi:hypothetical protein